MNECALVFLRMVFCGSPSFDRLFCCSRSVPRVFYVVCILLFCILISLCSLYIVFRFSNYAYGCCTTIYSTVMSPTVNLPMIGPEPPLQDEARRPIEQQQLRSWHGLRSRRTHEKTPGRAEESEFHNAVDQAGGKKVIDSVRVPVLPEPLATDLKIMEGGNERSWSTILLFG